MRTQALTVLAPLVALAAACSTDARSDPAEQLSSDPGADGHQTIALPSGTFELVGYGTLLIVDGAEVTEHHRTRSTCTIGATYTNEFIVDHADVSGPAMTIDLVGPATDYVLQRTRHDPRCDSQGGDTVLALDEVFRAHYPFFAERDVAWPEAIAAISAAAEADEFPEAFAALLRQLGDGHTTTDDVVIEPDPRAFGVERATTSDAVETMVEREFERSIERLRNSSTDRTGTIWWGGLTDEIGYLLIPAFEGLAPTDEATDDLDALRVALERAVVDLAADHDHLVIDMRFNEGGYEDAALLAAGFFTTADMPVYRKWAHARPAAVQTIEVEAAPVNFDGKIAVLSSPLTASAAENFILAMTEVADITLVGSASAGEYSDAIDWVLPDGTELTMSMEVYTDLDGQGHEADGMPVDLNAPFDEALDVAIEALMS